MKYCVDSCVLPVLALDGGVFLVAFGAGVLLGVLSLLAEGFIAWLRSLADESDDFEPDGELCSYYESDAEL